MFLNYLVLIFCVFVCFRLLLRRYINQSNPLYRCVSGVTTIWYSYPQYLLRAHLWSVQKSRSALSSATNARAQHAPHSLASRGVARWVCKVSFVGFRHFLVLFAVSREGRGAIASAFVCVCAAAVSCCTLGPPYFMLFLIFLYDISFPYNMHISLVFHSLQCLRSYTLYHQFHHNHRLTSRTFAILIDWLISFASLLEFSV